MSALALSLKLSAIKTLSAVQRAINILKSAGPGAWYDPSDLTTLFQDSAGTTPVTAVEQPVGLVLDKSQGLVLGPELAGLGTAWQGYGTGISLSGGQMLFSATPAGQLVLRGTSLTAGRTYAIEFTVASISGGSIAMLVGGGGTTANATAPGTYRAIVRATAVDGPYLWVYTATTTAVITSASCREIPGNHAIQPTATSRPTLSSRYNLLTKTEQFDGAVWVKSISGVGVLPVVTPNAATAPDGTLTADAVTFNCPGSGVSDNSLLVNTGFTKTNGVVYTGEISVKAATGSDIGKVIVLRHVAVNDAVAITLTDSWQRVTRTETSLVTGVGYFGVGLYPLLGASTGPVSVHIWGTSLVPASDAALPYQRVNTATDYDYDFSKFPPFLRFDGVDDSMYTAASIDFTSTDKMTVFAGVHKASDAATAALVELSANALSTNGAFVLGAPFGTGTATYDQYVRGTAVSGVALGSTPAPTTNVITAVGDIAGDLNRVTKNGTTSNQIGGDLGTGNFGNYPLYVGRRNNASLPFSGRIYQIAIKGKALSAAEIATVESFINSKTKAY